MPLKLETENIAKASAGNFTADVALCERRGSDRVIS